MARVIECDGCQTEPAVWVITVQGTGDINTVGRNCLPAFLGATLVQLVGPDAIDVVVAAAGLDSSDEDEDPVTGDMVPRDSGPVEDPDTGDDTDEDDAGDGPTMQTVELPAGDSADVPHAGGLELAPTDGAGRWAGSDLEAHALEQMGTAPAPASSDR